MSSKRSAKSSNGKSVDCETLLKAYDVHGDDFCVISERYNDSKGSTNQTRYYDNQFRLADGTLTTGAYLKYPKITINGCKSAEERAKNANGASAGFSISANMVGSKGEQIGKLLMLIADAFEKKMEVLKNNGGQVFKTKNIYSFVQKTRGPACTPMDVPLVRIKFRAESKDNKTLRGKIYVNKNGDFEDTYNGAPFTEDNIHFVVKGGSTALGVIDFSKTIISKTTISNSASSEIMYITPSKGFGLDADTEIDPNELDDMKAETKAPVKSSNEYGDEYADDDDEDE